MPVLWAPGGIPPAGVWSGEEAPASAVPAMGSEPPPTPVPAAWPETYKPESLVALQTKPVHQVAGLVGTVGQDAAELGPGDQWHWDRRRRSEVE